MNLSNISKIKARHNKSPNNSVDKDLDYVKPRKTLLDMAIMRIVGLHLKIPEEFRTSESWADNLLRLPYIGPFTVKYALLDEGLKAVTTTPTRQLNYMHELKVLSLNKVTYSRSASGRARQVELPEDVFISSKNQLAQDVDALIAISSIATALTHEQMNDWPKLIKPLNSVKST